MFQMFLVVCAKKTFVFSLDESVTTSTQDDLGRPSIQFLLHLESYLV